MGQVYNGGLSITIGTYKLDIIGAYNVTWEDVDDGSGFVNWDYTQVDGYVGRRFVLSVTADVSPEDKDDLMAALYSRHTTLICPDYEGNVIISGVSQPVKRANIFGTCYSVSFTATATAISGGSGGL